MRTVALLLDDPKNRYQQLLATQAKARAAQLQIELLDPEFADGSSWTQLETINAHVRKTNPPDALVIILAGEQHTGSWVERVVSKHISIVFLNRMPLWLTDIKSKYPQALIAGVAPKQVDIGALQGQQALRLVRPGSFVILVTGVTRSTASIERKRGFLDVVKKQLIVHDLDGRWLPADAEKAVSEWFRVGAERDRMIDLMVCQNDAMAVGAREALNKRAAALGQRGLARIPFIGCDGLVDEGQAMVQKKELTATVIMPPTTAKALDVLKRYWDSGAKTDLELLAAESFPALNTLGPS